MKVLRRILRAVHMRDERDIKCDLHFLYWVFMEDLETSLHGLYIFMI